MGYRAQESAEPDGERRDGAHDPSRTWMTYRFGGGAGTRFHHGAPAWSYFAAAVRRAAGRAVFDLAGAFLALVFFVAFFIAIRMSLRTQRSSGFYVTPRAMRAVAFSCDREPGGAFLITKREEHMLSVSMRGRQQSEESRQQ